MLLAYGRTAQSAVGAVSRLAEVYDGGRTRLSASDIAKARGLQKPFVAKLLTILSQAGLVKSVTGPGGGYWLARTPAQITLLHIVQLFGRNDDASACPLGPDHCGCNSPCAFHSRIAAAKKNTLRFLSKTHFGLFQSKHKPRLRRLATETQA